MTKKESLGEEIYSGTASFGRVMALISAVISTLIGIALIIGGIYILSYKDKDKSIMAKIIDCPQPNNLCCDSWIDNNGGRNYNCILQIEYTVAGKQYKEVINPVGSTQYSKGGVIKIRYDPSNPSQVKLGSPPPHWLGWVLIAIGVFIPIMAWIWVWLTRKYKVAAAAQGVGTGLSVITGGRL